MLVNAAASRWNVDPATCTAERGVVHHTPSGRSLPYGQLATAAAALPVPKDVPLKPASAFKLIGTPAQARGYARQGERLAEIRHRRASAGHESWHRRRQPGARRPARIDRRSRRPAPCPACATS